MLNLRLSLSLLVTVFMAVPSMAIDSRCSACRAVAAELQGRLRKEKPRNHLDLRHRLDSQGQRYGKSIDYKTSELRAVELLDDLCRGMKSYSLIPVDCDLASAQCTPATSSTLHTSTPAPPLDSLTATMDPAAPATERAELGSWGSVEKPALPQTRRLKQWVKVIGEGSTQVEASIRPPKSEEDVRIKELEIHCGRLMEDHEDHLTAAIMRGDFEASDAVESHLCFSLTKACTVKKASAPAADAATTVPDAAPTHQQQQRSEL